MLVASILDNRLFSWLAKISFGIYLWHVVVIEFIAIQFVGNYVYFGMKDQGQWALISSLVLLISVGIAALSWKWFEAPILRYVRNRRNANS
jgi:peptidoglycan/LPS O-acetylase OafA/YrhL